MGQKIAFATGIQGNYKRFRELIAAAERDQVDFLILGGNIFPDPEPGTSHSLDVQRDFLETVFKPFLNDYLTRSKALVLYQPGTNDLRHPTVSLVKFWSQQKKGRAVVISDGLFKNITEQPLFAYPYVPPTPNPVKDWEKWDDDESGHSIPETFVKGVSSQESRGLTPVLLSPSHAGDTIEGDLKARALGLSELDFLFVAQSPPLDTTLDVAHDGSHVGSKAIRDFILTAGPNVALHGHVLEAPLHSGQYWCELGQTLCINPGQAPHDSDDPCHYITFDLEDPKGSLTHSVHGPASDAA